MSGGTPNLVPSIIVNDGSDEGAEPVEHGEYPEFTLVEVSDDADLFDKIHRLSLAPDGSNINFVPENSLKVLFKDHIPLLKTYVVESLGKDPKTNPDKVANFICDKAPKIFATLIYSQAPSLIVRFFENELDDSLLPVMKKGRQLLSSPAQESLDLADEAVKLANQKVSNLESIAGLSPDIMLDKAKAEAKTARQAADKAQEAFKVAAGKVNRTFQRWTTQNLVDFCDTHQWCFMAPVFTESRFSYKFQKKTRMPFWPSSYREKLGNFSTVTRRQIDRNHLPQNDRQTLSSIDEHHPWVAEKKLNRSDMQTDQQFQLMYQLEADALKIMKALNNPHLIRTVASYRTPEGHYFMFPWADMGSLRDYWNLDVKKRLAPQYLEWLFTQLRGVAHAIKLLHDRYVLHGDLKPENILCFSNSAKVSRDNPCTLVIADAGLCKIHTAATHLRIQKTKGPKGSTVAYEPPEAEIQSNARTSRRYDVWSMGCICLEFLVWLIEGQDGLGEFHTGLAQFHWRFYEPIYNKKKDRIIDAKPHSHVVDKINSLRNRPSFRGESNPLGRLLEIIDKQMLVIDLDSTKTSGGKQAGTLNVPQPMTPANRAMTMNPSELPPGVRVNSDTMFREFDKILKNKTAFKIPSATLEASEDVQSSKPRFEHSEYKEGLTASNASGNAASRKSSASFGASFLQSIGVRIRRR